MKGRMLMVSLIAAAGLGCMSFSAAAQPIAKPMAVVVEPEVAVDSALISDGSGAGENIEVTFPVSAVWSHGKTYVYALADGIEVGAEIVTDAEDELAPSDVIEKLAASEWIDEGSYTIVTDMNVAYCSIETEHSEFGSGTLWLICKPAGSIYHLEIRIFVSDEADPALADAVVSANCFPQETYEPDNGGADWNDGQDEGTGNSDDGSDSVPEEPEMTGDEEAAGIIGWLEEQFNGSFGGVEDETGTGYVDEDKEGDPQFNAEEDPGTDYIDEDLEGDPQFNDEASPEEDLQSGIGEDLISTSYGTFSVPAGWEEYELLESGEVKVFVPEGWDGETGTDYITVEYDKSRFAVDEIHDMSSTVLQQLLLQAEGSVVKGYGGETDSGLPALVYEIDGEEEGVIAVEQYYIVEDYGYVLVNATNQQDDNDDVLSAAEHIADTFQFSE